MLDLWKKTFGKFSSTVKSHHTGSSILADLKEFENYVKLRADEYEGNGVEVNLGGHEAFNFPNSIKVIEEEGTSSTGMAVVEESL